MKTITKWIRENCALKIRNLHENLSTKKLLRVKNNEDEDCYELILSNLRLAYVYTQKDEIVFNGIYGLIEETLQDGLLLLTREEKETLEQLANEVYEKEKEWIWRGYHD